MRSGSALGKQSEKEDKVIRYYAPKVFYSPRTILTVSSCYLNPRKTCNPNGCIAANVPAGICTATGKQFPRGPGAAGGNDLGLKDI
ncbi:Uncharacterised protein [uncultured archaeon]|nr:Uncharacterised protein [uncultured archaeon]